MENPALAQQLKVLVLCGIGLIFAAILGWNIGSENYYPLVLLTAIAIVTSVTFLSGRYFWILTVAASFLGGTFPILGGQFTPFQLLMVIGVGKFVVGDMVLRRTRLSLGAQNQVVLISGFMAILIFHAIQHRLGMRFLGSSIWGGRNYVNALVGLAAFFVIQSIPIKASAWAKLPYAILAVTFFDLLITVITTVWPSSIYKIYPFYSAVSILGVEELLEGSRTDVTERLGAFGNFGLIIITMVLASVSIRKILHPQFFARFAAAVGGFLMVLYSGFRSAILNTLILGAGAGIRDLRMGVLALLPIVAALFLSLSIIHSQFFPLPKQVQRGLAFLPGDWDVDMASNAAASNEFRQKTWEMWRKEFFPVHPWIGRGFGFKSEWTKTSVQYRQAADYRQIVETGNIHNGFFSSVDCIGIIGTIFFVIWNARILRETFRIGFQQKSPAAFALRFLALYLMVSIISYWVGAQDLGSFLSREFALVSVFLALQRDFAPKVQEKKRHSPNPLGSGHVRQLVPS